MTASTDAKDNITSYTYDSSDRISTVSQGGISVRYSYSNDQLSEITHNGFTYNFIYDANGTIISVKINIHIILKYAAIFLAAVDFLREYHYNIKTRGCLDGKTNKMHD